MKLFILLLLLLTFSCNNQTNPKTITLYAASSLLKPINEINKLFTEKTQIKINSNFSSSASLAKKIKNGSDSDLFFSADDKWIDYIKNNIKDKNTLLTNSLVIITNLDNQIEISNSKLENNIKNCLVTGDPSYVPVGKYAEQFLQNTNQKIAKTVFAQDAVSTLKTVESSKCDIGIVYKTDAVNSNKVKIIYQIPENTHEKINYTLALLDDKQEFKQYFEFLKSETSKNIFTKYGFKIGN